MELSSFDKKLLNLLQQGIGFVHRPYEVMANELNTSEECVINRIKELKAAGYIRKIGAFFNSEKLGYSGALIALKVQEDGLEETAVKINGYGEVTHNYQRRGEYNLWFTLITNDIDRKRKILDEVRALPGVMDLLDLCSQKKYKINVQFKLR